MCGKEYIIQQSCCSCTFSVDKNKNIQGVSKKSAQLENIHWAQGFITFRLCLSINEPKRVPSFTLIEICERILSFGSRGGIFVRHF